MHSHEIERRKRMIRLNLRQRSIIVGTLLGDGYLETQDHGRTFRLKVEHSIIQKAYVDWLYKQLQPMAGSAPRVRERTYRFPNGSEKIHSCYGFSTYSLGELRFYAQQFYADGKKVIPKLIRKMIDPNALAIWYLDDGSFKSNLHRTYIIHSHGYTKSDLKRVQEVLMNMGVVTALHRQNQNNSMHWRIYVKTKYAEQFRKLIAPIAEQIPEMQYELGTHMPKK